MSTCVSAQATGKHLVLTHKLTLVPLLVHAAHTLAEEDHGSTWAAQRLVLLFHPSTTARQARYSEQASEPCCSSSPPLRVGTVVVVTMSQ